MPSPPPCQEAPRVDSVFVGKVLKLDQGTFELSVDRAFKGVSGDKVEIINMPGCSASLKQGRTYVVYATHMGSDVLAASNCSRTRSIEDAAEDLEFLEQYAQQTVSTRVSGTVRYRPDDDKDRGENRPPLPGVKVILESAEQENSTFSTVTDAGGQFSLVGVPPGKYSIDAALPGLRVDWVADDIDLRANGCFVADILMKVDRRVQGFVRDTAGLPLTGVMVEMVSTDRTRERWQMPVLLAISEDDGSYVIDGIPPGDYFLGVNIAHVPTKRFPYPPSYYTGAEGSTKPRTVHVGAAPAAQEFNITAGDRLPIITLRGRLLSTEGKPPRTEDHPQVRLKEPGLYGQLEEEPIKIDTEGRFSFDLCEGITYSAFAFSSPVRDQIYSAPVEFIPTRDHPELELILNKTADQFSELRKALTSGPN